MSVLIECNKPILNTINFATGKKQQSLQLNDRVSELISTIDINIVFIVEKTNTHNVMQMNKKPSKHFRIVFDTYQTVITSTNPTVGYH